MEDNIPQHIKTKIEQQASDRAFKFLRINNLDINDPKNQKLWSHHYNGGIKIMTSGALLYFSNFKPKQ